MKRREAEVSRSSNTSVCGRAMLWSQLWGSRLWGSQLWWSQGLRLLLHKQVLTESYEMKPQKKGLSFVIKVSASPGMSRMGQASKYWDNNGCFNGIFKWLERTVQRFIFV